MPDMSLQLLPARECRSCLCTDLDACAGGCSWVEEDLCSRCAGVVGVCTVCGGLDCTRVGGLVLCSEPESGA